MNVLGIETSTDVCSVGLVSDDGVWERSYHERRIHSEKLLVLVDAVLKKAMRDVREIGGVAVSAGPGSFTGLRIGASAAKGLVAALGCSFAAVPTFLAVRDAARRRGDVGEPFFIALDAKQGEWYCIESSSLDGGDEPFLLSEADCYARLGSGRVITDRPDRFERVAASVHDVREYCSGASVGLLGKEKILRGKPDDVSMFEPTYLKDFAVRTALRTKGLRSHHGMV